MSVRSHQETEIEFTRKPDLHPKAQEFPTVRTVIVRTYGGNGVEAAISRAREVLRLQHEEWVVTRMEGPVV